MPVVESSAKYFCNGAPSNGVDEVQTLTFGGTPTGGTFKLSFGGEETAAITWSATNNTLVSNIDAALEALANIGASEVTTAVGTMTNGIGTITVAFAGALGKLNVPTLVVSDNSLTGTLPTLAATVTTAGVTATARSAAVGETVMNTVDGQVYINNGAAGAPRWVPIG